MSVYKIMGKLYKNIIIAILGILLVVFASLWYISEKESTENFVDKTLKCTQLYELKKDKYWENEIGQSKSIFSKALGTCLALNIYNNSYTKNYYAMVIDMSNDKTLLYYSDKRNGFYYEGDQKVSCENSYIYFEYIQSGKTIKNYGCEKFGLMDDMFKEIRAFGFDVFDASL